VIQTPTGLGLLNARSVMDVRKAIRYFDLKERSEPENDRRLASEVMRDFRSWQSSLGRRPFFAFVNLYDAHDPYSPPAPWDRRFGTSKEDQYDGGVAYMDAVLDSTFKALAGQGLLDNTIVVVTADHGEQFGEHGLHNHGNSLYLPLVHVPLLIRYPARLPSATRVAGVVSLRDLPVTLVDLAGLRAAGEANGRSLMLALHSDSLGGEALSETEKTDGGGRDHPAAHGDMASLVNDSLHLILNGDGRAELYAYVRDPGETIDLAGQSAWCDALRGMAERLRQQSGYARKAPQRELCPTAAQGHPNP
jgi:arylsulfatase A-like enzyme